MATVSVKPSPWRSLAADPPETFWRSLTYFSWYRLVVALVFLGSLHFFGPALELGYEGPMRFRQVCIAYLLFAIAFQLILRFYKRGFSLQLSVQVMTDIALLTLLMYYSGGYKSGLTFMLLVVLAGAGLVGQGRLTLFFAAMATLAVMIEQAHRALAFDADPADFMHSGIVGIGFFATAISARLLAKRVVANENLARQRGQELAEQQRINERVIRDMQGGVLVVDATGRVRQSNPSAQALLGLVRGQTTSPPVLQEISSALANGFVRWNQQARETLESIQLPADGQGRGARDLQVRFLPAGEGGHALIYLEDMSRIQAQAQQLKLAALGRLTANMAHEIRNPLAAISHAAELLVDERRQETRERLLRIIGDNTQRLNRLVAEVLELGRRDRAQPEWLHLQSFIAAFVEEYALHDARIVESVVMDIDPEATLWFDRMHLNRVLANLVGNALRHASGHAGSLRLEARKLAQDARIELHVIDDGSGIDATLQGQVFEPFYTTHSAGTGLGLYIARELCEANAAQLILCPQAPGESGAHFCLTGRGEQGGSDESGQSQAD